MAGAFSDGWPSFLQKLSIPVTSQISEMGHWIGQNIHEAATTLFDSGLGHSSTTTCKLTTCSSVRWTRK
jgi:hypothetical protein